MPSFGEYFLDLPLVARRVVLGFLRPCELKALAEAIPVLEDSCLRELPLQENRFLARHTFKWSRYAFNDDNDVMAERMNHCMVYYEPEDSVYMFGGEKITTIAENLLEEDAPAAVASFNDLWKMEMNELILFGGYRYVPQPVFPAHYSNLSEVDSYNPETGTWRQVHTKTPGPKLSGHSAAVCHDWMLVYGGHSSEHRVQASTLFILDLADEHWYSIALYEGQLYMQPYELIVGILEPEEEYFPVFDKSKSHMVLLRDGLLLIMGEMSQNNYGSSVLVSFDPTSPTCEWKWKRVETVGRWFLPRVRIEGEGELVNVTQCAEPNFHFHQIASVQCKNVVRMVSFGRCSQHSFYARQAHYAQQYDYCQKRIVRFVRHAREQLELAIGRRLHSSSKETNLKIVYDGIICTIENFFPPDEPLSLQPKRKSLPLRHAPLPRCRVFLEEEFQYHATFDTVDFYELRVHIKLLVTELQAKHTVGQVDESYPRLPVFNRKLRRFHVFTSDVDISGDDVFETLDKIVWQPQHVQYRAAPETREFRVVGVGNSEFVLHGGVVTFNKDTKMMGHTYLLTGCDEEPNPTILEKMRRPTSSSSSSLTLDDPDAKFREQFMEACQVRQRDEAHDMDDSR